ncbi:uncharacterized protein ccdc17 isoform X3 [Anguilla anguilla]|uniref:uncharacterized protein ccdc17 isoform X3 n=1 Tax=Anguilla anguilla TaxID=7936 RepID=UPI0015A9FC24|nr:uncharacterized protein ccdc17 isoform X3 [Anguilla anguilla]
MEVLGEYKCRNCDMVFRSLALLDKHREHFCIGSDIGDPHVLKRGQPQFMEPEGSNFKGGPKKAETPNFKKREQKNEQARLQRWRERAEDRDWRSRKEEDPGPGGSDSLTLRKLTEEFHKLRMSIEESMPTLPTWAAEVSKEPSPRRPWEQSDRVREMAERHERQLAEIQAHNRRLEQEREEIGRKLAELAGRGNAANLEKLLLELQQQEDRNEEALQHIQGQIQTLHQQQGAREAGNRPDSPSFGPHEERKTQHMTFDLFSDGDGRLSSQIRALRLAYMQSGGADPVVLAQMHDLQAEAHMLEWAKPRAQLKGGKRRSKPSHRVLDAELLSVEKENQRLEEEILRIRLARERHRGEEAAGAELQQVQREQIHQMATVQAEIEYLRREVERAKDFPRERRQAPPPPPPPPFPPPPPVLPLDQMPAPPTLEQAGPHNAMQGRPVLDPLESLGPAPYDPGAGFVIFYDLVLGLEATLRTVRLVVGLYAGGHDLGRPTHLPPVPCQPGGGLPYVSAVPAGNFATLSVKQPVPRMQPSSSLALVVEVQAAGGLDPYGQEIQRLVSRGWAQLDLFDAHNQVRSGHWRLPVRALPVRPSLSTAQLNAVPQVGNVELCLRVANARDGDVQSLVNVEPGNAAQYKYPSVVSARPMAFLGNPPPPLTTLKPSANPYLSLLPPTDHVDPPPMEGSSQSEAAAPSRSGPVAGGGGGGAEGGMGVVVDRVKGAPPGEGGLRLTGYSQRTGKVLLFGTSGVLCCTSTVLSSIKHGDFIFGEQRISFCPAEPQEDMVLILRFYHWPGGGGVEPGSLVEQKTRAPWERDGVVGNLAKQEECASAWGVIRLTRPVAPAEKRAPGREVTWNTGTHTVPLYHVPVPPAIALTALPDDSLVKPFAPYGNAAARLHIYSGEAPLFPFPPESPLPPHASPEWPQGAYIFRERETPPVRPFLSGDGFDLYIDGARFLPDCVTVSRVTGRIFDRHYNQVGPDISTGIDLNSNIFEPVYDERVEIRCLNMPPSATLLLKLYTVDRFSLRMVLVGWTALGLFVESGSETQPSVDTGALQISLNEGAHQLRLYHTGPDPDKPLCTKALSSASRRVPCATVLVRVAGVPVDEDGRALSRSQVPEADWGKLGLLLPRPGYSEGGYYSSSARPTPGEASLQSAMSHRSVVLVREIASLIAGTTWGAEPKSDEEISDWIRQKLSRMMDSRPQPINLSMVSRYVSSAGLKVSVDRALNLPWAAFTLGLCTLSPPAAFYHGPSWVSYDRPSILQQLDFNSSQSSPQWSDGFKSFPRRVHHQHLTAIVHLHEVSVRATHNPAGAQSPRGQETLTYSLGKESWAALPIFTRGYCHTAHYQLPLYQGSPSQAALSALAHGECQLVLEDLRLKGQVQLLKGASVFVRVADGRRCEELEQSEDKDRDVSQLPPDQMDSYSPQGNSPPLSQLIPPSYTKDSFASELTAKFTQLVYQTLGPSTELGQQSLLRL